VLDKLKLVDGSPPAPDAGFVDAAGNMVKLSAAGVDGRVEFILGAEHGWAGEEWDRTWKETMEFFDARLKKP